MSPMFQVYDCDIGTQLKSYRGQPVASSTLCSVGKFVRCNWSDEDTVLSHQLWNYFPKNTCFPGINFHLKCAVCMVHQMHEVIERYRACYLCLGTFIIPYHWFCTILMPEILGDFCWKCDWRLGNLLIQVQ